MEKKFKQKGISEKNIIDISLKNCTKEDVLSALSEQLKNAVFESVKLSGLTSIEIQKFI